MSYHSDHGLFGCLEDLIKWSNIESQQYPAVCIVQNITVSSSLRLGSVWRLEPDFFVEHVRRFEEGEMRRSLYEGQMPGSGGGLKSTRGGKTWGTFRGFVDHGRPKDQAQKIDESLDTTRRCNGRSTFGSQLSHSNMSFYKVNEHVCKSSRSEKSLRSS